MSKYTHAEWCRRIDQMRAIESRIYAMRRARAVEIGKPYGLPISAAHNASIDTNFTGWAAGPNGPEIIKTARRMLRLVDDWTPSRLIEAWDKRVR